MNTSLQTRMIDQAKTYFQEVDNGRIPDELFAPGFEFFFPKFGVGRGHHEFHELGAGLGAAGYKVTHHREALTYSVSGLQVIVEGTTQGNDADGRIWNGGETPGGRFCSVFGFGEDALINRMYIYLDPDYTSLDEDRFHWRRKKTRW